ncbi:MAG TPA: hypothetical protein VFU80_00360 [Sphingomicrobium sp.]|nr:hypothetical protein [Sphingomicrobium sp.]
MRSSIVAAVAALSAATVAHGQEIVEVPASEAGVSLPEDIFGLPPGQWFVAKQVSQGSDPCTPESCEAGFNSGSLVVSVEHAREYVRVIAGFRGCPGVAFQEIETGVSPGKPTRNRVSALIKDVVKGAEKSCKVKAPSVPRFDVASLFPKPSQ